MALFAEYLFEEGSAPVLDSSGNNRTLTVGGGSYSAPGKDSDFAFQAPAATNTNGARALMTHPTAAITLMCWVNPSALGTTAAAAAFGDGTQSTHVGLFTRRTDFGPGGVVQGNIRIGGLSALDGGDSAPVDTWTHLAITYDGTDAILYVNAVPVDTLNSPGTIGTGASNEFAVSGWVGAQGPANLQVDDVRVYDNALSQAEIEAIIGGGAVVDLFGDVDIAGGASATLTVTRALIGTANAASGASGVLSVTSTLFGNADTASSADGTMSVLRSLVGNADAASDAVGTLYEEPGSRPIQPFANQRQQQPDADLRSVQSAAPARTIQLVGG